jgi:hypothetical protein
MYMEQVVAITFFKIISMDNKGGQFCFREIVVTLKNLNISIIYGTCCH